MGNCDTYCTHGGVCELDEGHEGQHDSRYCKWDDADSIDRDEADRRLANHGGRGQMIASLWNILIPRKEE